MALLSFFVSAPAWNLFLLFTIPIALSTIITVLTESLVIMKIGMLLDFYIVLLWEYSVCTLIYKKYSSYLSVPIFWFKISIGYIFLYSVFFSLFFEIIPSEYLDPLHLVSFACNIYCLYFLSKLIVTVEKKSKVKFKDYFGTLISAWILIIGIWKLQPRINGVFLIKDV